MFAHSTSAVTATFTQHIRFESVLAADTLPARPPFITDARALDMDSALYFRHALRRQPFVPALSTPSPRRRRAQLLHFHFLYLWPHILAVRLAVEQRTVHCDALNQEERVRFDDDGDQHLDSTIVDRQRGIKGIGDKPLQADISSLNMVQLKIGSMAMRQIYGDIEIDDIFNCGDEHTRCSTSYDFR